MEAFVLKDEQQINELLDLITQEVSLVDRGANKRKFLVVKQKGGKTMAAELEAQQDGRGNLVVVEEKVTKDEDSNTDVAKDGVTVSASVRQDTLIKLSEVLERTMGVVKTLKDLPEDPDDLADGALPPQIVQEISVVQDLIKALAERHMSKSDETKTEPAKQATTAPPADQDIEKGRTEHQMFARMDKLMGSVAALMDEMKASRAPSKKIDDAPNDVAKRAPAESDIVDVVRKLSDSMTSMATVAKRNADDIAEMRSRVPASNSVEVEKSNGVASTEQFVSWPLDMNNPITRDTVKKADWVE